MKLCTISLISRIREKSSKFITDKLAENGIKGVVPSHGDIMAVLFSVEKCTMKELANRIRRTKSTLTILVDKLVTLALIEKEKSHEDSRITYIKLTDKGFAFKPVFEKISKELNSKVYNGFTDEEADAVEHLLEKISNNLN